MCDPVPYLLFEMAPDLIYVNSTGAPHSVFARLLRLRHSLSAIHVVLTCLIGSICGLSQSVACDWSQAARDRVVAIESNGDLLLAGGGLSRLAGLAWPSIDRPAERRALKAALDAWLTGFEVDALAISGRDRWGRRAVRLRTVETAPERRIWVEAELLGEGIAIAWPEPGPDPCWEEALAAEHPARRDRLGQWSALHGRSARTRLREPTGEPMVRRIVFRGVVQSVRNGRQVVFVNFIGARDSQPAWMLTRRQVERWRAAGRDPATFVGKSLIIRGDISGRPPGRLTIGDPRQVQFED